MPKLTKSLIDKQVHPLRGQVILRDDDLKGFGLRVSPKCKSFILEYRVNDQNHRITIGRCDEIPFDQAKRDARRLLSDIGMGYDPLTEKEKARIARLSLSEALELFLSSRLNMLPSTKLSYRKKVHLYLSDWLPLPVRSITKDMVEERHRELGQRVTRIKTDGKPTANGAMEVLRIVLKYAADKYQLDGKPLIEENPVSRLTLNRQWYARHARQGVIPDHRMSEWYQSLMSLDSKISRDYFLLLMLTGLRRREASRIKWSDVDFEAKTLNIPQTKNGKEHRLPLTDFLAEVLKSRLPSDSEYVFPGRDRGYLTEPRTAWAVLRKKMGFNFLIHDLRRVFLTTGEKIGVTHYTLKKLANHSIRGGNDPTGAHYVVVTVEDMRPAMNQITDRLLELMGCTVESWKLGDQALVPATSQPDTAIVAREDPEPVYFYVAFSTNR